MRGNCGQYYVGMFLVAATAIGQAAASGIARIVPPGATLERVLQGYRFLEGPAWSPRGSLIFSDINANVLYELSGGKASVYEKPSYNANGNTYDRSGALFTCHQGSRSVTRRDADGTETTLASSFEGKRLNSPNDIVVRSDGTVYFTDPPYGIQPHQQELAFNGVFRIDAKGALTAEAKDFIRPNGLALSPSEKRLYVDDTQRGSIYVFDVAKDGSLSGERLFAHLQGTKPGVPDGMRIDARGNVYCTGPGGIHVLDSHGRVLGVIAVPEVATNVQFGDRDLKTLYITAQGSLYRIRTLVGGEKPR